MVSVHVCEMYIDCGWEHVDDFGPPKHWPQYLSEMLTQKSNEAEVLQDNGSRRLSLFMQHPP